MAVGLNSRPKEWSRPTEPHPSYAGCWCSRNKRRPCVSLIWCGTPSGHENGLRPWIQTSGRRTALQPVNLSLDFEHAHVSSYSPDGNRTGSNKIIEGNANCVPGRHQQATVSAAVASASPPGRAEPDLPYCEARERTLLREAFPAVD